MRRFVWFFAVVACAAPADAGRGRWTTGGPRPDAYLVVVDPLRSDVVYASIGSGGSLYRSVDGGRSWTPIASPPADSIAVDPSDDDLLYLGNFNIFFSRDFGVSWSEVAPDLTASDIQDIVVAPDDTDTLYVETHTLATGTNGKESYRFARVRRGTEGTWSWSVPDPAFTTAVTGLVADASSSGTIFASGTGGVYRSTDAGNSWTSLSTGIPTDTVAEEPAIHSGTPSWLYVPIGTTESLLNGVLVSRDGGDTWTIETDGLPGGPLRCAAVDPRDPEIAYVGSAGEGVFRTVDGGQTWRPFDTGLSSPEVFSLAVSSTGRVYAGTSDGVFVIDPMEMKPVQTAAPTVVRRRGEGDAESRPPEDRRGGGGGGN